MSEREAVRLAPMPEGCRMRWDIADDFRKAAAALTAPRPVRDEVLEEAAKVADAERETFERLYKTADTQEMADRQAARARAADAIATAIRALKGDN